MNHVRTILWANRDSENFDCCSLLQTERGFLLRGVALLSADNLPMRVSYSVDCTDRWETQMVEVRAWKGDHEALISLQVDEDHRWWQDGNEQVDFRGLVDVDLGFTPATNTLPIRRMKLEKGGSDLTTTVWVQFPGLELVRFPQRYTRIDEDAYLFESLSSSFRATLRVDKFGLVTDYETLWYQIVRTT